MKVLVTGANGQLGRAMQRQAAAHPEHTYCFTDRDELDICSEDDVSRFVGAMVPDLIVNCAAYTAVDKAEQDEAKARLLNVAGPANLARAAQEMGASLLHVSTDYVFDGRQSTPYVEEDEPRPLSVYGQTKLDGERAVLTACGRSMVIRTSWLYGHGTQNFVQTMLRLGGEREEVRVVFDQVGTPTYAADLAMVIHVVMERGVLPGIYHFSNEGVCSWYDFARAVHRLGGVGHCKLLPIRSCEYPTLATRPSYTVLDKARIKRTYDLNIPHWEESLERYLNELKQR